MSSARSARRRMLAVSLGAKTMAEALAAIERIAVEADIVELRLDYFEEPFDLERLVTQRPLPVVVTNRPIREGGRSTQTEDVRLAVLRRAAELGAEYVDVEWDAAQPEVIGAIKSAGSQLILSRHSFERMPADFEDWYDQLARAGADVVKIVGMARSASDVLPVLRTLERASLPTIAIAMGEAGLPSRVLALRYDSCFLTYATLGTGERVAPGQLPLDEMRRVYRSTELGPQTTVYGILEPSVDPSVTASLNRCLQDRGANAVAVPMPGASDPVRLVRAYRSVPVAGWLVRDEAAMVALFSAVDQLRPAARLKGKVNLLVNRSGQLLGDWVERLDDALRGWTALE